MSEKMREEFEAAIAIETGLPAELFYSNRDGDTYEADGPKYAWWAWKRACLTKVITLPKGPTTLPTGDLLAVAEANAAHNMRKACKVAIEAAGLVVA